MGSTDGSEKGDEGLASPVGELGTWPQRIGCRVIDLTTTFHKRTGCRAIGLTTTCQPVGALACYAEACCGATSHSCVFHHEWCLPALHMRNEGWMPKGMPVLCSGSLYSGWAQYWGEAILLDFGEGDSRGWSGARGPPEAA